MSTTRKPDGQPGGAVCERPAGSDDGKVILFSDVRVARQHHHAMPLPVQNPIDQAQEKRPGSALARLPDLAAIARHPSYAERRRRLAEAMAIISGQKPSERLLDHQMMVTGLAAGHGTAGGSPDDECVWPLGSTYADPAVVVGLVLHHAKHAASRGLPMPASLLTALNEHVASGSAAARLVRDWLSARLVSCGRRQLWVHRGGQA